MNRYEAICKNLVNTCGTYRELHKCKDCVTVFIQYISEIMQDECNTKRAVSNIVNAVSNMKKATERIATVSNEHSTRSKGAAQESVSASFFDAVNQVHEEDVNKSLSLFNWFTDTPLFNWYEDEWFSLHYAEKISEDFKSFWLSVYWKSANDYESKRNRKYWENCAFAWKGFVSEEKF